MKQRMLQYRGSLKSCNYSCSYCPFARRSPSPSELSRDEEDWYRFIGHVESHGRQYGAVMVVPYGEALIHSWYLKGLARLSRLETMEAVGAQTNLSFDVEQWLHAYEEDNGNKEKLRLWVTFHPEMTTVSCFADQCRKLLSAGIRFCAGAVGVPENLGMLIRLRGALPTGVYLWINRMDGLRRRYTREEEQAFTGIDPWFSQELHARKSNPGQCRGRLFVEAGGGIRQCNIAVPSTANWFDGGEKESLPCGRNACTCYLAYGGRADYGGRTAFGRWPLFRIPWNPRAVFLDLDGTVLPKDSHTGTGTAVSKEWIDFIRRESRTKFIFLSTSLPRKEAAARCPDILPWISGGIYAAGAHVVFHGMDERSSREIFHTFEAPWISWLSGLQTTLGFRLRIYRQKDLIYKITLSRPKNCSWRQEDLETVTGLLPSGVIRCFTEDSQLQIVSYDADKGSGIRDLCAILGISPLDTAAVGDSNEDTAMFRTCGYGIAVPGCSAPVAAEADFIPECCPTGIRFQSQAPG